MDCLQFSVELSTKKERRSFLSLFESKNRINLFTLRLLISCQAHADAKSERNLGITCGEIKGNTVSLAAAAAASEVETRINSFATERSIACLRKNL